MWNFSSTQKNYSVIRKRRIGFYGHITRMDPKSLTRRIFAYFQGRQVKSQWITNTENGNEELGITEEDIKRRDSLRDKLPNQIFRKKERRKCINALKKQYAIIIDKKSL